MSKRSKTQTQTVRCAIYTRKSHEEGLDQEFNSLDAQRQSGESYVQSQRSEGWHLISKRYDDGGFSGGTMDRPALNELIQDIECGRIDCVVVYKVDRLSRSLMDFSKLISLFDEHKVSFVSVTQQFNTTTSMGRLTLNILLSFAQFEREIISERIRDKKMETARKGKYSGGQPFLGYDIIDKKLVVNTKEAKLVRLIFKLYLKLESSRKVAEALNAEGYITKILAPLKSKPERIRGGKAWNQGKVRSVLNNKKYIGLMVHKGHEFPGEQEAIVPAKVFEQAQKLLLGNLNNGNKHKHLTKRFSLLRRLIHCGHCGSLVMPSFTTPDRKGTQYRYYTCTKKVKTGYGKCQLPSLPAGQIETAVVDQLRALLRHPDVIARTYNQIRQASESGPDAVTLARLEELGKHRKQTEHAIQAVLNTEHQDGDFLADELKRLNNQLRLLNTEITGLEEKTSVRPIELNQVTEALRAIDPVWDVLVAEEQQRIIQLLIEYIVVTTSGIKIRFRTNGIEQIVEEIHLDQ